MYYYQKHVMEKNDEVDRIERERNMVEQPSATISYRNQKVFIITTTTKKYTISHEDDSFLWL
jgi:hypothetical protein